MAITAAGSTSLQLQTRDKKMPFKSVKQQRFMNANKQQIGAKTVDEFNQSSKGMKLPMRAGKKMMRKPK